MGGVSRASLPALLAGRFRVMAPVGRGAIAEVVRARDERTGAEVALKILYPHLRESAVVVERFRREVEIVRRIAHPYVLAIHDVVEADARLFLVMDYHPGGDLADRLARQARLSVDEVRALAAQLCGALAAAHRAGVVHRDVKPSNVLCGAGPALNVRLCDFGLARATELSGLTTANAVLGTPEYMAPEVVTDGHADPRSDIYSLGVMLFEAATGKLPFYGDSPYQLMRQHVEVEAPRARTLAPELPAAIDAAIARALAKDPLDRFATVEDLGRVLADESPATSSALIPASAAAPARRACPHCAGWIVDAAAVCADCGVTMLSVEHEKDGVSVLVIGPGQPGDKLDAVKHVVLYRLLDELPRGSVALERGGRRAPRVPFYVARELTDRSADRLIERLQAAGFDAVPRRGGVFSTSLMRKKLWEMTKRQSAGLGLLGYVVPRFSHLFDHGFGMGFFWATLSGIGLAWAASFAWAARKCGRPLVDARTRTPGGDQARRLSSLLARLATRQDRRLVAHILERNARIAALGRGDVTSGLVERGALAAEGLAALAERRSHDASVSVDSQGALAELRREEMTAVVLRGELLRVASRLDDAYLLIAGSRTPDEIAGLDETIRDLEAQVSAEQEIVALLGERR